MNDRELLELAASAHKSRNQREGVYCGKAGKRHIRYGSLPYGFKPYPLRKSMQKKVVLREFGFIDTFRLIPSDTSFKHMHPMAS